MRVTAMRVTAMRSQPCGHSHASVCSCAHKCSIEGACSDGDAGTTLARACTRGRRNDVAFSLRCSAVATPLLPWRHASGQAKPCRKASACTNSSAIPCTPCTNPSAMHEPLRTTMHTMQKPQRRA
eukprot:97656-Chlamydomonas_euryale.AAC.1